MFSYFIDCIVTIDDGFKKENKTVPIEKLKNYTLFNPKEIYEESIYIGSCDDEY